MGLSSNQARFLSLTARQVDLEQRIQQICQRRLRLSSELENVATTYNNSISNRKMYTKNLSGMQALSVSNLAAIGYKVIGLNTDKVVDRPAINPTGKTVIDSQDQFMKIVTDLNNNIGLGSNYVLNCDIDMSSMPALTNSLITKTFTGTFDGNGHSIKNLTINAASGVGNIGMFSSISGSGAKVSNISLEDCNINTSNSSRIGGISGDLISGAAIDNCYVSGTVTGNSSLGGVVGFSQNSTVSNCTSDANIVADISSTGIAGGIVGNNSTAAIIKNCVATGNVTASSSSGSNVFDIGGLAGGNYGGHIENSSSSGDVNLLSNNIHHAGGFVGTNSGGGTITNSYTTGSVVSASTDIGGFAGNNYQAGTSITYSYASNPKLSAASDVYGFAPSGTTANAGNTNFFTNGVGYSYDNGGTNYGANTTGWSSSVWDLSSSLPKLQNTGYTAFADGLDEGLRNGTYSIAREADEFTQETININGKKYEEIDWRSNPDIFDELYKGDDVDAENKYDKTISEINSQDKKLQLEQTSVEVEYKAISSERESVKKILDTNAQSSFKYFS